MLNCWDEDPHPRPRFSSLVQGLSDMLEEEAGYFNLSRSLSWKKEPEQRSVASPAGPALLTIVEGGEEAEEEGEGGEDGEEVGGEDGEEDEGRVGRKGVLERMLSWRILPVVWRERTHIHLLRISHLFKKHIILFTQPLRLTLIIISNKLIF